MCLTSDRTWHRVEFLAKRDEYGRRHVCPWSCAAADAARRRPAAAVGDRAANQGAPDLRRLAGRGWEDRHTGRSDGAGRVLAGDDQARQRQHGHALGGRNGESVRDRRGRPVDGRDEAHHRALRDRVRLAQRRGWRLEARG